MCMCVRVCVCVRVCSYYGCLAICDYVISNTVLSSVVFPANLPKSVLSHFSGSTVQILTLHLKITCLQIFEFTMETIMAPFS